MAMGVGLLVLKSVSWFQKVDVGIFDFPEIPI